MILALFENWFFEMSYSAHKRTLQAKQAVQSKLEVFLKNIVPTKPSASVDAPVPPAIVKPHRERIVTVASISSRD